MDARRIELSEALRRELDDANLAYQSASQQYRRLMQISIDTSHPRDPALLDGSHALRQAMRVHRQAQLRYQRALRNFTDLILDGKMPNQEDPL